MTQLIKYDTGLNHPAELNWLHFAGIKILTESQAQTAHTHSCSCLGLAYFCSPQMKPTL